MSYTHILECSGGLWLAYLANGRWVGRPAKRTSGGYAVKARYKCDILAAGVLAAHAL
jgi:hypothetical protein